MKAKLFKTPLIVIILFGLVFPYGFFSYPNQVLAKELPEEFLMGVSISGMKEGIGFYFEIKDSEYLDVSLRSSEEVRVILESVPRMINLDIESVNEDIDFAELVIKGLEPNKTYYKYQDGFVDGVVFISDEKGSYTWNQDLSKNHHVWIQEVKGTLIINEDTVLDEDIIGSVQINADNITLDCNNHTITGNYPYYFSYGVYLNNRENVTIKNCFITNFVYGIYLYDSNYSQILNNNSSSNGADGIRLHRSSNNTINNNICSSNGGTGILLWARHSNNNNVSNNECSDNREGITLFYSHYSNIANNNISNNESGVRLFNSSDTHIIDNNIDSNDVAEGIILSVSSNVEITGNQFINSGIFLGTQSSSTNLSYFNTHTIENNTVNGKPIYYYKDVNGIKIPEDAGQVILANSNNITIENLNTSLSSVGIQLAYTNNSRISNNETSNNVRGIYLDQSSYNEISENNILNNIIGVYLYNSSNNKIYHNNFVDNLYQAIITGGSNNLFDNNYPSGGNYWSDYTGIDADEDGIGDSPYAFTSGQDNYPFMNENGWETGLGAIIANEKSFYNASKANIGKIDTEYTEMAKDAIRDLANDVFGEVVNAFVKIEVLKEIEDETFKGLVSEFSGALFRYGVTNEVLEWIIDRNLRIENVRFSEFIDNKHEEFGDAEITLSPEVDLNNISNDIQEKQITVDSLSKFIDQVKNAYQAIEEVEGGLEAIKWTFYVSSGICVAIASIPSPITPVIGFIAGGLYKAGKIVDVVRMGTNVSQGFWIASLFASVYKNELNITKIYARELDRVITGLETAVLPVSEGRLVSTTLISEGIKLGNTAPFFATFKNTGEIDTEADLVVEIKDANNHTITYRSNNESISLGEEKDFILDIYFPYPWCKGTAGFYFANFYVEHGIFPDEVHEDITDKVSKLFEVKAPSICSLKHIPFIAAGKSKAPVTIFLKNNTDLAIENISVIDEVPKELAATINEIEFITPYTEIIESDPIIKWVVDLGPGETKEIKYQIEIPGLETGEPVEFPGVLVNYIDPETGEEIEQTSGEITTVVSDAAISFEEVIVPTEIKMGEEFDITAYIKNRGDSNAENVSIILDLPDELELVSGGNLVELGSLAGEEIKDNRWTVKTKKAGLYTIEIQVISSNAGDDFIFIPLFVKDLISHWNFDNDFKDSQGNNDGVVRGGVHIQNGNLVLDGDGDYVKIYNPTNLELGNEITLSAWIKTSSTNRQGIIKRGNYSGYPLNQEYALYTKSGNVYLSFGDGTNYDLLDGGKINDGTWHLITGLLRSDKTIEIYVDGILKNSGNKTVAQPPNFYLQTIGTLKTNSFYFNGLIDDVKIWNYALSGEEINEEYQVGRKNRPPVSHWNFDNDFKDSQGNNDGVVRGGVHIQNGNLVLDGDGDYVKIYNPTNLELGNEITLSAWIKTTSNNRQGIIKRGNYSGHPLNQEYALYTQSGNIYLVFGDRTNYDLLDGGKINDGTWHLVTGVLRSDKTIEIYVDGILKNSGVKTVAQPPDFYLQTIGTLKSIKFYFNGLIDDVKIWNYALSAEEINLEYQDTINLNSF